MRAYVSKPGSMYEANGGHGTIFRATDIGGLFRQLKAAGYAIAVVNGQDCILATLD